MPALLGGCQIIGLYWIATHTLNVVVESSYANKLHQVYYGRQLVGVSNTVDQRLIAANVMPDISPDHLSVAAVDVADRLTDFGDTLPDRPYNRLRVAVNTSGWPADSRSIHVVAGAAPDAPADPDREVAAEVFDTDRTYQLITSHFRQSGTYYLQAFGRDDKRPAGNIGTPADFSAEILAYPPDVVTQTDGSRMSVSIEDGIATISYEVQNA